MNIYSPIPITDEIRQNFVPCRLYIKELAGMKYFGKTIRDPYKYTGSGIVWIDRIKKYGKENIKTLWVSDLYADPELIQNIALSFSQENNIVESSQWANLKPENGLSGGRPGHKGTFGSGRRSAETKRKLGKPAGGTKDSVTKGNKTKKLKGIPVTAQLNTKKAKKKAKLRCNELENRPIVNELRKISRVHKIKLGSGWVRKPDHWILTKIAELISNHNADS